MTKANVQVNPPGDGKPRVDVSVEASLEEINQAKMAGIQWGFKNGMKLYNKVKGVGRGVVGFRFRSV